MTREHQRLVGKVVVVTGAGRGIGRAIAIACAGEDASVCCAARTSEEIVATAREVTELNGRGLALGTDVTQRDSVNKLFAQAEEELGGIDIVVVNAGGNLERDRVEDSDPDSWVATVELNLIGAYYTARAAIPYLRRRGAGKIIMIGSGIGHNSRVGASAYACAKSGLWMLTRVLAQELWDYNISVNELISGPVSAQQTGAATKTAGSVFSIDSEWVKTPEDVAPLTLFMATQPDRGPTAQSYSLMRRGS